MPSTSLDYYATKDRTLNYVALAGEIFNPGVNHRTMLRRVGLDEESPYGAVQREKREVRIKDRADEIKALRESGLTWKQVGDAVGLSGEAAYHCWYRSFRHTIQKKKGAR